MRFGPEDEHVSLYGKPLHHKTPGGQLLLKTLTGTYGYADENGHDVVANHHHNNQHQQHHHRQRRQQQRYPSLPIGRLLKAFCPEQQWCIESIRISHVQLLGTKMQFQKLASCLTQCHTLKTVIFGDSRTASLVPAGGGAGAPQQLPLTQDDLDETTTIPHFDDDNEAGFDTMVGALATAPHLQEVSLQNMPELSAQALGTLCRSTSLVKLQLLLSQSVLPTGCITGTYLQNMTQSLKTNRTLKELRIFGVLDYDACRLVSEMLLVNRTLQKLALKIKLKPSAAAAGGSAATAAEEFRRARVRNSLMIHDDDDDHLEQLSSSTPSATHTTPPLLDALASSRCSLASLEIYISGSRVDLETYATAFTRALQVNQSLQHLNVIFYGLLDTALTGALAAMRTNELWMTRLAETLQHGNYTLQQILINHGLLELAEVVKFYLRLNRAGRRHLLMMSSSSTTANNNDSNNTNTAIATATAINDDDTDDDRVVTPTATAPCFFSSRNGASKNPESNVNNSLMTTRRPSSEIDLWLATLGRVRNDLSCIFYFLSCNPTLFCGNSNSNCRTANNTEEQDRRVAHAGERRSSSSRAAAWRKEALEGGSPPLKKKR